MLLRVHIIYVYRHQELLPMLSKDGMHLLNCKGVNFPSGAKMGAPVALDEGQQTSHLTKAGLGQSQGQVWRSQ